MAEYIEREALGTALNRRLSDLLNRYGEHDHYSSGYAECVDAVEDFPAAADVAPVVHGGWKQDYFFDEPVTRCSACGVGFAKGHKAERFPYCPNCGARMDGGADNA